MGEIGEVGRSLHEERFDVDLSGLDDVTTSLPELYGCVTAEGNPIANCALAPDHYTQDRCTLDVFIVGLFSAPARVYTSLAVVVAG